MSSLKPVFIVAFVLLTMLVITKVLYLIRRPDITANQAIVTAAPHLSPNLTPPTLLALGGPAFVSFDDQVWSTVDSETFVIAGQSIKTSDQASAVIIYSDGSQTRLSPASQVHLDSVTVTSDQTSIHLSQSTGQSWHRLVPRTSQFDFTLTTASVSAVATSPTSFSASIDSAGINLAVAAGSLQVTVADQPTQVLSSLHQLHLSLLASPIAPLLTPVSPDAWWQQNTRLDQDSTLTSLDQLSIDRVATATKTFYLNWSETQATISAQTP